MFREVEELGTEITLSRFLPAQIRVRNPQSMLLIPELCIVGTDRTSGELLARSDDRIR